MIKRHTTNINCEIANFSRTLTMCNTTAKLKVFQVLSLLLLAFLLSSYSSAEAKLLDRVVAVVNGEVITNLELEQASQGIVSQLRKSVPPANLDNALLKARQDTLDEMIETMLIVQKAKELKIRISSEEITSAVEKMAADNNLSVDQLYVGLQGLQTTVTTAQHPA